MEINTKHIYKAIMAHLSNEGYVRNELSCKDFMFSDFEGFNSIATVKLIVFLEEYFNIEFDLDTLTAENLESIKTISILVENKLAKLL